jgi:putative aminopeptidase FrvX
VKNEILQELCAAFGPTGRESRVREIVMAHLEGLNLEVYADALGNVIVRKGDGPYPVFCTHLDQPGWVVEHRDKKGFLHLRPLPSDAELGAGWAVDEEAGLYRVFRGPEDKSWRAESLIEGKGEMDTFLVPKGEFEESRNAFFATALADRAGPALLIDMAQNMGGDQSAALIFYTGRHLGFAGLPAALETFDIERFYLVEALPCDKGNEGYSSGDGPVVLLRTQRSVAPAEWVEEVEKRAQELDVKLQKGLGSDFPSAADVLGRRGIPSLVLGVPLHYHSSRIERMAIADYETAARLLENLLRGT